MRIVIFGYEFSKCLFDKKIRKTDFRRKNEKNEEFTSFKCVSIFKSKVKNLHLGIREYIPIVFDEDHCALANINIHSSLLGLLIFYNF